MTTADLLPYQIFQFGPSSEAPPLFSLSVSVYKKTDFFALVLASLQAQSFQDFELIVCDDGSPEPFRREFQELCRNSGLRGTYVWHPDQGFRKNEILNKGIRQARGRWMVFIDGDCVLHPQFLKDYAAALEPGVLLAGRRVNLTAFVSGLLTPDRVKKGFLPRQMWWIFFAISGMKDSHAHRGIHLRSDFFFRRFNQKPRGVVGSNFAVERASLLKINGFDMNYRAPGTGEDSDIEWRLNRSGFPTRPFLQRAIQYHLWHRLQDRDPATESYFKEIQKNEKIWTDFGLEQLAQLSEPLAIRL